MKLLAVLAVLAALTTAYQITFQQVEEIAESEAYEAAESEGYDLEGRIDEQSDRIDELERRGAMGW